MIRSVSALFCNFIPGFLVSSFVSKWFLSRPLFPSRDRGPWGRSELIVPRLTLQACTRAGGVGERVFGRAPRILPEIFRQNFALATRTLRQMRKWCARRCCHQWFSVFSDLPPRRRRAACDRLFFASKASLPCKACIGRSSRVRKTC